MSSSATKVFLTGATGDVGSQTLALLQSTQTPTRILCRRQAQADRFNQQAGVEAIVGNLNDPVEKLASYMAGCTTLFLLTAAIPEQLAQEISAIDAAVASKSIKFIVKISAGDLREDGNVPWTHSHFHAEKHMREQCDRAGLLWTSLRASGFMSNFLQSVPAIQKGFLPQTSGNGRAGWVDTADIAVVAHRVILDGPKNHAGQVYVLTGPRLINMPELATILSQGIGHRVRYLHLPSPIFKQLLKLGGADEFMANGLVAQFVEIIRPGLEGVDVSNDIENITGKRATSFEEWVAKNEDKFKGFDTGLYIASCLVAGAAVVGLFVFRMTT
ncbi:hypothetical protein N0V93_007856 [Gnomoniopsis smithogilvyi]|uniref:NmrA-like domain-containing protein n=1 Tax=Gnomoniopsis smithogilvyi TaxID=1191159 RepID=A0A9W8YP68_9PEZI|nr:hypothetical protein N0V93_007856 [Gnomoniopsis smithogilvyi]